jgi:hypothetical protein
MRMYVMDVKMVADKRRKISQCYVLRKIFNNYLRGDLLTGIEVRDVCKWYSGTIPAESHQNEATLLS